MPNIYSEPNDRQFGCDDNWRTALDWSAVLLGVVSGDPIATAALCEHFRSGVKLSLIRETKFEDVDRQVDRCLRGFVDCIARLQLSHVDDILPILRCIVKHEARILIEETVKKTIRVNIQVSNSSRS